MKGRLLSLDVLRGMTVAGMIIVNNAGGRLSYDSLRHSVWNGLTPCDLVFPFFLFIMGISTYIALRKWDFTPSAPLLRKVARRTVLILLIGWAIHWLECAWDGNWLPVDDLRLTGVLTRIALCYGMASLLALYVSHRHLPVIAAGLLVGYALILWWGNGYQTDETNLLGQIDRMLLGAGHLYRKSPIDPEGLVGTLPALAHTLIGVGCGRILLRKEETLERRTIRLFVTGFLLLAGGYLLIEAMPLNKRIWSPTFTLATCGAAALLLATLTYYVDLLGRRDWCRCFEVFGVNPLFLYVLSEVGAIVVGKTDIKEAIYTQLAALISNPYLASAIYSLLFTAVMAAAGYVLYRKKIYIKI